MGQHRHNPRAIAAGEAREIRPGEEAYGFELKVVVELNKEKLAEAVKLIDAAKAAGQDPRFAVPRWNSTENPEFFDYVVYNVPQVARPSSLIVDKIPLAQVRWSEHLRIPLVELRLRADAAFAGKEAEQEASH